MDGIQNQTMVDSTLAQRVARANGYAVHNAGGTELLVDMAAAAHECTEPSTAAGGTNQTTTIHSHGAHSAGSGATALPGTVMSSAAHGAAIDGVTMPGLTSAGAGGLGGLGGGGKAGMVGGPGASPQLLTARPHAEAQKDSVCEWYCYLPPHLVGDAPVATRASTDSPVSNEVSHHVAGDAASSSTDSCTAATADGQQVFRAGLTWSAQIDCHPIVA
eukprot:scaffold105507_cov22-Tisochrysis_lutea.AAC.3